MAKTRMALELGMGTSLRKGDYTRAAVRAVQDALCHSSISLFRSCGMNHRDMLVKVTIGVQDPSQVDADTVAASLPRGNPQVEVVHGGLNIADPEQDGPTIIASASVEAFLDVEAGDWQISEKENG